MRILLSFWANYAEFIKRHSLINKITSKCQKVINALSKMCIEHNQRFFSNFPPNNTVKLENVGPTFSSFRPFLSYPYVATPVLNKFRE